MPDTTITDTAHTPAHFLPHAVSIGAVISRLEALATNRQNPVPAPISQIRPTHRALTFLRLMPGSALHFEEGTVRLAHCSLPVSSRADLDPWVVVQTVGAGERLGESVRYSLASGNEANVPLDSALFTFDFFRHLAFAVDWVSMADPRTFEALETIYSIADFEWDGHSEEDHHAPCRLHSTLNMTLQPGCLVIESTTGDSFFRGFSGLTTAHSFDNVDGELSLRRSTELAKGATTVQAAVLTRHRMRVWN